jgi:hypothetical protein
MSLSRYALTVLACAVFLNPPPPRPSRRCPPEIKFPITPSLIQPVGATTAEGWRIAGELEAFNTPGQDEKVTAKPLGALSLEKPIRLPAHSIAVVQVRSGSAR